MNKIIKLLGLRREAILLDSRLYIIKSMVALSVGYILGRTFQITRLDMISVLLGVMYNLEPNNTSAFKSGMNQLLASALGAITTSILIFVAGYQINFITVAIGIGFTLYISLKIDYRMVSPVAIFTSIYMTQFLQHNEAGAPSIVSTFILRIAALGLGVLVALIFNYLFSLLYYRQIGKRRLEFLKLQGVKGLKTAIEILYGNENTLDYHIIMAGVFNDIEMVKTNIETMMKENIFPFNHKEKKNLKPLYECVVSIKNLVHLAYDCVYYYKSYGLAFDKQDIIPLTNAVSLLESLDFTKPSNNEIMDYDIKSMHDFSNESTNNRLHQNMMLTIDQLLLLLDNMSKLS